MPGPPDHLPHDWSEAAEDAAQFFRYRAQAGAAALQMVLSPADITGMLKPPPDPDRLTPRLVEALAEAYRRDCAQAEAELKMAAAIGEPREAPDRLWVVHRAALLERPERSALRTAVEQFQPRKPGWWSRLLAKLRGSR